jgi:hypothetical protein
MAKPARSRSAHRDRHDRGMRRPLLSKLFKFGQTRSHGFEQYVETAMEYLKGIWAEDLEGLTWSINSEPSASESEIDIPRWKVDRDGNHITIYRIPTERFGSHSRKSALEERLKVEQQVFEAIADLLDIDPWDLVPDYYNR